MQILKILLLTDEYDVITSLDVIYHRLNSAESIASLPSDPCYLVSWLKDWKMFLNVDMRSTAGRKQYMHTVNLYWDAAGPDVWFILTGQ